MHNNGVVHYSETFHPLANQLLGHHAHHQLLSQNHQHSGHAAQVAGLRNLVGQLRNNPRRMEDLTRIKAIKKEKTLEIDRVSFPELEEDLILDLSDFFSFVLDEYSEEDKKNGLEKVLDEIGKTVFTNSVFNLEKVKKLLKEISETHPSVDSHKQERPPSEVAMIRALKAYVKNSCQEETSTESKESELMSKLQNNNSETLIILRRLKIAASRIYLYILANSTTKELGSKIRKIAATRPSLLRRIKIFSKELSIRVRYIVKDFLGLLKFDDLQRKIKKLSKDFGRELASDLGRSIGSVKF
jgi:hypothetical protein